MSVSVCCVKGFQWNGQPRGRITKIADRYDAYVAGDNAKAAVLIIQDIYGWAYPNARLMADHYAREATVTAIVPDLFGGEHVKRDDHPNLTDEGFLNDVLMPFVERHNRNVHDQDVFVVARALRRELGFEKVAAIGFCYGAWAVLRLGAAPAYQPEEEGEDGKDSMVGPLVDAVSMAHPSFITEQDIAQVAVPLQVLAPEHDYLYTAALKQYTIDTLTKNGVALDYLHFPGVEHSALIRGNDKNPGERAAMVRAKAAAVAFFKLNLGIL